jgi:membrane protein DedA with SNARE-associated domain
MDDLISAYGYWAVLALVAAEGVGLPVPGETALVGAAIYAGTTHHLDIVFVVVAASFGAVVGNLLGFWIGREFGYDFLLRHGRYLRLDEAKLKLGQYLFFRHGGKVVFFGRFVAFLRTFSALLAGINGMPGGRFLLCLASSCILWAALFGFGGYFLGEEAHRIFSRAGLVLGLAAAILFAASFLVLRPVWRRLEDEAERHFPGPLRPRHPAGW